MLIRLVIEMVETVIKTVKIEKSENTQVILGHAGFIKTAEDLYEALINSAPGIKFGVAFNEASGPRLVRTEGNDEVLRHLAAKNALAIGAGHTFVVLFDNAYPVNVSNAVKGVVEVSGLFCATANPVTVVIAKTGPDSAVIGVADGSDAIGSESEADMRSRREFVRRIGYKLQ